MCEGKKKESMRIRKRRGEKEGRSCLGRKIQEETMGGEEQKEEESKRCDKGEESRAGNSCCGEEQMVLGGVVMAAVPGHPPRGWADPNN